MEEKKRITRKKQAKNPITDKPEKKKKIGSELREKMSLYLVNNFETFENDLQRLEDNPTQRAKLYLEVVKMVLTKPQNEEEDLTKEVSQTLKKLFPET